MLGKTGLCLITFLILASVAVQAKFQKRQWLIPLNPDSFKSFSDDQRFLVQFYVPNCKSCAFLRLDLNYLLTILEATSNNNITVGTLDCIKHENFCHELNITEYPTMGIFEKRGEQHRFIDGSPNMQTLQQSLGIHNNGVEFVGPDSDNALLCEPGSVQHLNSGTFTHTVASGVFFIKFYSPKCVHCNQLAPTWIKLSKKLKGSDICVAEVDCLASAALCRSFNVTEVPHIAWFQNGKEVRVYTGPRDLNYLEEFAKDMIAGRSRDTKNLSAIAIKKANDLYLMLVFMIYIFNAVDCGL
ncbi:thioredoxin domain-containing protein 5-like [Drosophila navojoa]|uniref:thioredoxin domain-containing protein 5-like n=1 Tax=Drosophila navojoa TaxID=7232 RepID=UPI0011BE4C7C|nr:thioredoxin domain-containing protein 5-like [Drosophila navojoa]